MENSQHKHNDRHSLNRLAVKAGIFYIFAQLLVRGITFLTTPIYTRLLSQEQYADIRLYESWLLIAVPTLSLCLWKSVDRAKYDTGDRYNEYVGSSQTLSYLSIGGVFLLCMIFREQVKAWLELDDLMFYMAFLYIFAYTSILYLQRREKQLMRYKVSTFVTAVTVIPATFLSVLLIWIGKRTGHADALVDLRVIGFYVPHVIGGAVIAVLLWTQGKKPVNLKFWKYGLLYSLPLIPEAISIQIMNQADKIMVRHLVSKSAASIIALGTTVSFIIWILEDSVWNAWLPWLFEKISRGEEADVEKPWTFIMHGFGMISWFLVLLAPEVVTILGPAKYRSAIYLSAPMIVGTLFRFFSYIYSAVENYYKKTGYVAATTVVTMIINVILNYICIRQFGYMAAAYTTAASYFILLLLQCWAEYHITGTLLVPLKKTALISLGYFLLCCVSMLLYECHILLRYSVLLIGVLMAVKFILPQFLKIIKTMKKK
ncbi:MAG: polysaccharide biosynthesis C-terminal domain-containing protein [Eubacteriales bacterium]|nr:polysaccharide biosynthesis C-terminal domain-containing protein [Eubacteriales bacterium]